MALPLLVLLFGLLLVGLGSTMKVLLWIGVALIVVWFVGLLRPNPGKRFYGWGNR